MREGVSDRFLLIGMSPDFFKTNIRHFKRDQERSDHFRFFECRRNENGFGFPEQKSSNGGGIDNLNGHPGPPESFEPTPRGWTA